MVYRIANFWLSVIVIMNILKKPIVLDKLHEYSTLNEVISNGVEQKLLPTISFKRWLSLEICSQTQRKPTVDAKLICWTLVFNNCRLYFRPESFSELAL